LLREQIYDLIEDLFTLQCAKPGEVQDVFLTLSHPPYFELPATHLTQRRSGQPGNSIN
jgi:hypothetical protein